MQQQTFGQLFKRYKKEAGFKTLSDLTDALTDEGLIYSESLLSRWQKDSRLPKDREVYLIIIKLFVKKGAIKNIYQANQLLSLAGEGYLSREEVEKLLKTQDLELNMDLYQDVDESEVIDSGLVKISLVLPRHLNRYLEWVSSQYQISRAEVLRSVLDKQLQSN